MRDVSRTYELVTTRIPVGAALSDAVPLGIRCLVCGRTSWNADDVANRYCGFCHDWHDQMAAYPERRQSVVFEGVVDEQA